ncbi:hypothetical protein NEOLEDRAFT_1139381 [Neolentinus lepideus HHB14362 ss-1]|uniref:Uncharacterized protein n=1 Tax=Neolentinus lepideus HHB14362 ss-1 TaxID=1314782 RepID=A0A165PU81_9AGAM|nr:hypothetical protein NEOLEDRAFT_1139381 [Neolentinus lepideus HHB14362 ss-1]
MVQLGLRGPIIQGCGCAGANSVLVDSRPQATSYPHSMHLIHAFSSEAQKDKYLPALVICRTSLISCCASYSSTSPRLRPWLNGDYGRRTAGWSWFYHQWCENVYQQRACCVSGFLPCVELTDLV